MSDKARVLAALRQGDVRPSDFHNPPTGKPIMRLAARIGELRADGYDITTVQTRPQAVYRLQSSPSAVDASVWADGAGAHRPPKVSSASPTVKARAVPTGAGGSGGPSAKPSPLIPTVASLGIAAGLEPRHLPSTSPYADDEWEAEAA